MFQLALLWSDFVQRDFGYTRVIIIIIIIIIIIEFLTSQI